MARPRKQTLSQAELASRAGVTVKTLRTWRDSEGLDLDNAGAVMRRAANSLRTTTAIATGTGTGYAAARLRKVLLECRRIELAIQRENEHFVSWETIEQSAQVFHSIIRACLKEIEGCLPEVLNGLSPPQMGEAIKKIFFEMQDKLSRERFMDNHPETKRLHREFESCDRQNLCRECRQAKYEPPQ